MGQNMLEISHPIPTKKTYFPRKTTGISTPPSQKKGGGAIFYVKTHRPKKIRRGYDAHRNVPTLAPTHHRMDGKRCENDGWEIPTPHDGSMGRNWNIYMNGINLMVQ